MPKPTSYQLLKDIHKITSDLDSKYEKRFVTFDNRVNKMESNLDKMAGKASIGIIVLSTIIGTGVSLIVDWVKSFKA